VLLSLSISSLLLRRLYPNVFLLLSFLSVWVCSAPYGIVQIICWVYSAILVIIYQRHIVNGCRVWLTVAFNRHLVVTVSAELYACYSFLLAHNRFVFVGRAEALPLFILFALDFLTNLKVEYRYLFTFLTYLNSRLLRVLVLR
jgi:hypothetical protein